MKALTQTEKELIIVVLSNALSEPKDSDIHPAIAELYDKLRLGWASYTDYHTAKEIIDIREGKL